MKAVEEEEGGGGEGGGDGGEEGGGEGVQDTFHTLVQQLPPGGLVVLGPVSPSVQLGRVDQG